MIEVQTAPSIELKSTKTCQTKEKIIGGTQIIETLQNVDKAVILNNSTSPIVNIEEKAVEDSQNTDKLAIENASIVSKESTFDLS